MKVIISHPTGNQNSRNAVMALQKGDMLEKFYTSVGVYEDSLLNNLNFGIFKQVSRRSYSSELKGKIIFHPNLEILRLLSIRSKLKKLYIYPDSKFSVQKVFEDFDCFVAQSISKSNIDALYAYAGTAFHTFKEASRFNITKLYEQHGCYWKTIEDIAKEEIEKKPEWSNSINLPLLQNKNKEKLECELEMADRIIVASKFCSDSIPLNFREKTLIVPYGFSQAIENKENFKHKKLKVLFVGNLSQMKGLSYLFDAVSPYKDFIELSLIGSLPAINTNILNENLKNYNYLGTMSHSAVLDQMRLNDVLIFPTLLDAFGMVISEAMTQGTAVIATTNSAGSELIDHGKNGWVIPPRSSEAIKKIFEELLSDTTLARSMGDMALKKSKERSWLDYQSDVVDLIKGLK